MNKIKDAESIIKLNIEYLKGNELVSDSVYEELLKDFRIKYGEKELNKLNKQLKKNYSALPTAKHLYRILDFKKTNNRESIQEFITAKSIYVEPKLDGVFIGLLYENSRFTRAILKGDGLIGGDVTVKIRHLVPEKIDIYGNVELYAELICSRSLFDKYKEGFATPRSLVVSYVNSFDLTTPYYKLLDIFIHGLDQNSLKNHFLNTEFSSVYTFLNSQGFKTPPVIKYSEQDFSIISDLDYDCDGLMFKLSNVSKMLESFCTRNVYTYMIVFKFTAEIRTTVLDIEFIINKSGSYIPVLHIFPIYFSGITCSRIQGYNVGFLRSHCIGIGSVIVVRYKVIFVFSSTILPKPLSLPELCLTCNEKLLVSETDIICCNEFCKGRLVASIVHSLKILGVKNVGLSRVKKLFSEGKISKRADLFKREIFPDYTSFKSLFKNTSDFILLYDIHGLGKVNSRKLDSLYRTVYDFLYDARNGFCILKQSKVSKFAFVPSLIEAFSNIKDFEDCIKAYEASNVD